jgi:hypothetical protein
MRKKLDNLLVKGKRLELEIKKLKVIIGFLKEVVKGKKTVR